MDSNSKLNGHDLLTVSYAITLLHASTVFMEAHETYLGKLISLNDKSKYIILSIHMIIGDFLDVFSLLPFHSRRQER